MSDKLAHILTATLSSLFIVAGNVSLFAITLFLAVVLDFVYCFAIRWKGLKFKGVMSKITDNIITLIVYLIVIFIAGVVDHSVLNDSFFNIEFFILKITTLICLSIELKNIEKTHIISGGNRFRTYTNEGIKFIKTLKTIFKDEKDTK